jgi:drug/metabolite transporter (DMT)-like permease
MALRYTISALVTGIAGWGVSRRTQLAWRAAYVGGGLLMAGQAVLFGLASQLADASITGLCFFGCASLTASIWGFIRHRTLPLIRLVGLLLGLVGLLIVLKPVGPVNAGAVLAVLGGMAWGGYVLWSKYGLPQGWGPGIQGTSRTMGLGAVMVWAFALVTEPHGVALMSSSAWWGAVYMGLIPQALGFVVFGWLANRLNPVELGVSQFGTPLLIVVGGTTILGEGAPWTLWVGMACVIAGMILASSTARTPQMGRQPGVRQSLRE